MPTRLRRIAVHVEEPKPGRFAWVLSEAHASAWQALDRSGAPAQTYHAAMADGLLALQALVEDLDAGPRVPQEKPALEDDAPKAQPADAQEQRPAKSAFFGFGPAR